LSFNGGKDCTVLLHLWAAVIVRYLKRQDPASTLSIEQRIRNLCIPAVYVCAGDPFPEVEAFTEHYIRVFGVVLHREQGSMRNALGCFLKVYPNIQAILVGVRRTDPYAATLRTFQMTDAGWPEFMRIHPILDWDYADIWLYLRALKIPYCSLYERGFTSLGGIHNTRPNPALRMNESHSPVSYQPAWKLTDGSKERDGRV
jgi:FAD synthetase